MKHDRYYGESVVDRVRLYSHRRHPSRVEQGYVWQENSPRDKVDERVRDHRSKGLDVCVEEIAVDGSDREIEGYRAIFARPNLSLPIAPTNLNIKKEDNYALKTL